VRYSLGGMVWSRLKRRIGQDLLDMIIEDILEWQAYERVLFGESIIHRDSNGSS